MQLSLNGVSLGTLVRYGYETPWASAWLVADDPAPTARYAAVCAFFIWCDALPAALSDAEADVRYAQGLAAHGLDEDAVDAYWGDWQILMPDGEIRPISPPHVEPDGFMRWRW